MAENDPGHADVTDAMDAGDGAFRVGGSQNFGHVGYNGERLEDSHNDAFYNKQNNRLTEWSVYFGFVHHSQNSGR